MMKKFSVAFLFVLFMFFTASAAFATPILIHEGSRGADVRAMQERLIELEYMDGKPDDVCGKIMAKAIRRFQRDRGLAADGIIGPKTYAELMKKDGLKASEVKPVHEDNEGRDPMERGEAVYVTATAYSAYDPGNGHYTASGTLVRHGVIAVDPSFIPLGTRVYIPGYGEAVAEDIGGNIVGNIIDVAFDSHEEALGFGRQELEIFILEYP